MKDALGEVTAKNAEKKSIGCAGSASCAGPAGGKEGHTSYDSLPKGACSGMQWTMQGLYRILQNRVPIQDAAETFCEGRRISKPTAHAAHP